MTTTYTFDIFTTLDGFAAYDEPGDWGGYWGKQGPELLDHRLGVYGTDQRMVLGASTFRENLAMLAPGADWPEPIDPWVERMRALPVTVISSTLAGPFDWPDVTVASGDGVEVVARLKEESPVPLRSHGSLTLNRALLAAGLVDRIQVTVFPVISGRSGIRPVFGGAPDLDLELIESRTLDGRTQELVYRPSLHG